MIGHFFNPQRIEPIGYDSKRNAYWLIGGKTSMCKPLITNLGALSRPPLDPARAPEEYYKAKTKDYVSTKSKETR